jgi:glycosyltransferase involved in cell wall biosynthesis
VRIAVVNNFFPPRPGGSSHLADHLAKKYAGAGHEVLVLTAGYKDAPADEVRDGFRIVRVPAWVLPKTKFAANFDIAFTIGPRAKRTVFRILDEFQPDVIHQHGQFFDLTWLSGLWARKHRIPTLLSIHTRLTSANPLHNSIYWLADFIVVKPFMWVHKPKLVVMDVLMDQYIQSRYRRLISGKVNIPVGIDPGALRGGDGRVVRERHDFGDRHVVLSLGHVIPQRSRVALVEALPAVLEQFPDIIVVVIGGIYYDAFLKRARQLGVEHSILALGPLPQREVPDYLAAADLEVHELEGGGFGTASLESLAVGIPVVAAIRRDNFIEVAVEDRKHLFLTPFVSATDERADPVGLASTLIEVLSDPVGARERVSQNAKELINAHFTIDQVAAQHIEVLESLVKASKSR